MFAKTLVDILANFSSRKNSHGGGVHEFVRMHL
jgi:hypothetical protein